MILKKSGKKFCLDKITHDEMECLWSTLHMMYADDIDEIEDNHKDEDTVSVPIGVGLYILLTDELEHYGFFNELRKQL